ncbi:uncharacterized protein LOC123962134 [Micropterus dolomieu]|uniref:uncharacterized protein LOC123962134 n=1 Tax=Micropterus dolomieu TaxID=147949 RepID=UPI001E8CDAB7|nr:uncharacterized protein LOC123962134 [Micropterus dolomieu]XP_045894019.1 uncharacterized protein LOC123962134 [Micropterus dolomieu]XP_045894020.1 uncharacterized protein LOC123962134 [Micropterus dolomieu]
MTAEGMEGPHSYSGLLRHAANQLSEEVLGKKLVPYTEPWKYTGELIGIEYLYSQNNTVMEDYKAALTTLETEDITVAEGESHMEQFDVEDPTVPSLDTIWPGRQQQCTQSAPTLSNRPPASNSTTLPAPTALPATASQIAPPAEPSTCSTVSIMQSVPERSGIATGSYPSLGPQLQTSTQRLHTSRDGALLCTHQGQRSKHVNSFPIKTHPAWQMNSLQHHQDSVGPDNIEGSKADYLFKLRDHSLALSREEAAQIFVLWECLSEYDKGRTIYPPRHQDTIPKGRFRATKKCVAPGVESTKRCFAGGRSPAQWPDCNRVCEALFVQTL